LGTFGAGNLKQGFMATLFESVEDAFDHRGTGIVDDAADNTNVES
jgi:hypothetical protein